MSKEPFDQKFFETICNKNNFRCKKQELFLLNSYVEQLLSWNKKINLISRKDEENVWLKHIIGSLTPLFFWTFQKNSLLLDVGTGGGLPGIPLAIFQPENNFILVDSIQKKVRAVNNIIKHLELKNVKAVAVRVNDPPFTKEYHQKFDYILSRAVASIQKVIGWCLPLLKKQENGMHYIEKAQKENKLPSGTFIFYKGGDIKTEIEEAQNKYDFIDIRIHNVGIEGINSSDFYNKKLIIIIPNIK